MEDREAGGQVEDSLRHTVKVLTQTLDVGVFIQTPTTEGEGEGVEGTTGEATGVATETPTIQSTTALCRTYLKEEAEGTTSRKGADRGEFAR